MAHLGCSVVICSRKQANVDEGVSLIRACMPRTGGDTQQQVFGLTCNIKRPEDVLSVFEAIKERCGGLDFLVNNAGGQFPCKLEDLSLRGWQAVVETNLQGTFLMCQTAFKSIFRDQGHGNIINIIVDIYKGFPGMAHTGAARAGENIVHWCTCTNLCP
jgi:NAD(P)-dependent dehydrogenase (short-subunit alcohol dehydrogenase family)